MLRVFFAHPKSMEEDATKAYLDKARIAFEKDGLDDVEFITGREDYAVHAVSAGGWKDWAIDVVDRIDMMTRDPFYNAILVPGITVGAATKIIVATALTRGRPVLAIEVPEEGVEGEVTLKKVVNVVADDPENYTSGWWLDT
jgi:hypothetical protein